MWNLEFWPNMKTKTEPQNHGFNGLKVWKSLKLFGLSLDILKRVSLNRFVVWFGLSFNFFKQFDFKWFEFDPLEPYHCR